jgi:hypothetical protein
VTRAAVTHNVAARRPQESGLLNRPEIPQLAGSKPLLVKAYDLGLVDAGGATESRFIGERLALSDAHVRACMGGVCVHAGLFGRSVWCCAGGAAGEVHFPCQSVQAVRVSRRRQ